MKQRKVIRAKIQKVHDVLYKYSHEKMDYFLSMPELCYVFCLFYNTKELGKEIDDEFYREGVVEIYDKCKKTLAAVDIFI